MLGMWFAIPEYLSPLLPNFNVEAPLFCQAWIYFRRPLALVNIELGGKGDAHAEVC